MVVEVAGTTLNPVGAKRGMLMDYGDLKAIVQPLVDEYLDHHYLNDTLKTDAPTSEFVALWVFDKLKHELYNLRSIRIEETCTSSCTYESK